ncbi:hypothetical protein CHUAL_003694 [Chamberlinius hualienensis]
MTYVYTNKSYDMSLDIEVVHIFGSKYRLNVGSTFGEIVNSIFGRRLAVFMIYCMTLLFVCEYLIYHIIIASCNWPENINTNNSVEPLKVMFISDTHLLGFRNGHWFDKLRREWQMFRSFKALSWHLDPEVVFFLGDLFDEGLWASRNQFNYYVERFNSLFGVNEGTKRYVVVGNHDIGFHYSIRPMLYERFKTAFNSSSVELVEMKGNTFVLINSMAMEGDNCFLCKQAEDKLKILSRDLQCANKRKNGENCVPLSYKIDRYSRPVLLQHFPLFRKSDETCQGSDVAPPHLKNAMFREKVDCLSESSTQLLLNLINPRVVFSGHTHYGCQTTHSGEIIEFSVPSFSWRNINNPSAQLVLITPENYIISKCFLPMESMVINLYISGFILPFFLMVICQIITFRNRKSYKVK